ncbi:MAG: glycosyl transferase family 2 [Burkholderiales bacterium]|nr:MAG: glycosyl transferase family 2 [Burkholderiales bacterium]
MIDSHQDCHGISIPTEYGPRVSVVIPVRDCKNFIQEAVRSVISQSFQDFEVLIIDDGSIDWNYKLLEELDARIQVICLTGTGVSHARNVGMQHAKGEFIAFLDADDVWFPGKLRAQIRYLDAHEEVGVVFGGFSRWITDESGVFIPAHRLMKSCEELVDNEVARSGWLYIRLLSGLLVGMNTAVIRKSVYSTIGGFNEGMRLGEDYDFWLKASRVAEMHSLDGAVALYRIHTTSAMHRISDENHLAILLKAAYMRWGILSPDGSKMAEAAFKARMNSVYFDHGYTHYWRGKLPIARKSFWATLRGGYRPLRSLVYFTLCLFPRIRGAKGEVS